MAALTERQRRFVEAFRGNASEAARAAGYRGGATAVRVAGHRLLKNPNVVRAIHERQAKVEAVASGVESHPATLPSDSAILDLVGEQSALSAIARDATAKDRDRIRAIEILARMQGHFARVEGPSDDVEKLAKVIIWHDNARGPAPADGAVEEEYSPGEHAELVRFEAEVRAMASDRERTRVLARVARDASAPPFRRIRAIELMNHLDEELDA